jgi:dienelactone hydrolase
LGAILATLVLALVWLGAWPAAAKMEPFEQRITDVMAHADVLKPAEAGRHPIVVQLHGCGGKKSFQATWAKVAHAAGFGVIVLDSFGHRGISTWEAYATVCVGARLWGRERTGDLFAALEWARRQEWVDPERLIVAGWSHGGWTVLDALAIPPGADLETATNLIGLPSEPLAGVRGAYLLYPYCGYGCQARRLGLRIDAAPLAIVGGKDSVVGGASLRRTLHALSAPTPIQVELFPTATHAFDEPDAKDLRVRHDPVLTARAHILYRNYLLARSQPDGP